MIKNTTLKNICDNFNNDNDVCNLGIIAGTGYGKTELLKSILNLIIDNFNFVYLYTSSISYSQYNDIIFPSNIIIKTANDSKVIHTSLFDEVVNYMNCIRKNNDDNINCLIIVDDLDDVLIKKITDLGKIRHSGIKVIILAQSMQKFGDSITNNITMWLMQPKIINSSEIIKKIGITDDKKVVLSIINEIDKMVIDKEYYNKAFIFVKNGVYVLDSDIYNDDKFLVKKKHMSTDIKGIENMIKSILKDKDENIIITEITE